jgi:hypothetical protein
LFNYLIILLIKYLKLFIIFFTHFKIRCLIRIDIINIQERIKNKNKSKEKEKEKEKEKDKVELKAKAITKEKLTLKNDKDKDKDKNKDKDKDNIKKRIRSKIILYNFIML